jgi:polyhydroxyalkanoate synthase
MTIGANEASRNVEDVAAQAAEGVLGPNPFVGLRPADLFAALGEIGEQALKAPLATLQQEAGLARALFSVLAGTADIAPAKGDRRFSDPAWNDNPFYRRYLQGYLAWTGALDTFIESTGLDSAARQRARFVMSLLADSVAPTNTLLGNPAALKKAIDSGGKSLLEGLKNLLADVTRNGGMPAQVDKTAFEPGRNLALSPGSVVWRNEVLELIQYAPATGEVYARPQLIVPPRSTNSTSSIWRPAEASSSISSKAASRSSS